MIRLKVDGVAELHEARICAAGGADYIGFELEAGRPRYVPPAVVREIAGWISGPESVGLFGAALFFGDGFITEEALDQAARVSRSREYRVEAYLCMATIHQTQEHWAEALGALRKASTLQPNNWAASQRLASILARLGRADESRRALKLADSWRTPEWL